MSGLSGMGWADRCRRVTRDNDGTIGAMDRGGDHLQITRTARIRDGFAMASCLVEACEVHLSLI